MVFDSDLNRPLYNMPCYYPLEQKGYKVPITLIKEYAVVGENERGERFFLTVTDNHLRFVKHRVDWKVKTVRFVPASTHGSADFRLFGFEVK